MWYVHPLSTTKPMCLPFVRRLRVCLSLERAERVATRARALEAMRRSMHELRVSLRSRAGRFGLACLGRLALLGESISFIVMSAGPGVTALSLGLATCTFGPGTARGRVSGRAGLSPINVALVW
eukprot:3081852-Pleurochrysis_carterae.AAC.1